MRNFYMIRRRAKRGRCAGPGLSDFLFGAFISLLILSGGHVLAAAPPQAMTVSGRVTDDTGAALPGANVVERGTTNGTVTDVDGQYEISVSSRDAVLVFSFVGAVTQQVPVANKSEINVQLLADQSMLNEIVVVGYGTQKKSDITGAIGSVKSDEFNKGIINSPAQLLQGKVSGVQITSSSGAPGSGQRIIIRGQGSIRQGTGTLFVVDGFPLGLAGTGSAESPLNFINPEDIESIDVLKNALLV